MNTGACKDSGPVDPDRRRRFEGVPRPLRRVLLAACVLALASPATAAAATAPTAVSVGFDISFPQCGGALPPIPGFGIVGVNDGHGFSTNPCLATELAWAQSAANAAPAFYLNTQNPGPTGTLDWPVSQTTPQACAGNNSTGCAYDYGWSMAAASYAAVLAAEAQDGATTPSAVADGAHWWLDVETANQWETTDGLYANNATIQSYDQASLLGMLGYLHSVGVTQVGIYSTVRQWTAIMGVTSAFAGIPVWVPGLAANLSQALLACTTTSFTGGRVAMIQYPSLGYDGDYVCGLVEAPVTISVSPVGSLGFSQQLVADNASGAVTYAQSTGQPQLLVSPSGLLTTAGTLPQGSYSATGTITDASGDTGSFQVTLDVGQLVQQLPTAGRVKVSGSAGYSAQLAMNATSPAVAPTFVQSTGQPQLLVSSSGLVTTSGTLPAGTYHASGTVSDTLGDTGTFAFTLTVGQLVQRPPLRASVSADQSATFHVQLDVGANLGPITYAQTSGQPALVVSPTGLVTTSGPLAPGTYPVGGTVSDTTGDVGTFAFTLTVTPAAATTTTTTTPPPTTTTTAVPSPPRAVAVIGRALAGRTRVLTVTGSGFFGRPRVTSHPGTRVIVARDTGRLLVLHVSVRRGSRNGVFVFTLIFKNGQRCRVRYLQG